MQEYASKQDRSLFLCNHKAFFSPLSLFLVLASILQNASSILAAPKSYELLEVPALVVVTH